MGNKSYFLNMRHRKLIRCYLLSALVLFNYICIYSPIVYAGEEEVALTILPVGIPGEQNNLLEMGTITSDAMYETLRQLGADDRWEVTISSDPVWYQAGTLIISTILSPGGGLNLFFVTSSFFDAVLGNLATIPICTISLFDFLKKNNLKELAGGFIERNPTKIVVGIISAGSAVLFIAPDSETAYVAMGNIECPRPEAKNNTISLANCTDKVNNYTFSGCDQQLNETPEECDFNQGLALMGGAWNAIPGYALGHMFLSNFIVGKMEEIKEVGMILYSRGAHRVASQVRLDSFTNLVGDGSIEAINSPALRSAYNKLSYSDKFMLLDGASATTGILRIGQVAATWAIQMGTVAASALIFSNIFNAGKTIHFLEKEGFEINENGIIVFPDGQVIDVTHPEFTVNTTHVAKFQNAIDSAQQQASFYEATYALQGLAIAIAAIIQPFGDIGTVARFVTRACLGTINPPLYVPMIIAAGTAIIIATALSYPYSEVIGGAEPSVRKVSYFRKAVGKETIVDQYLSPETQTMFAKVVLYSLWVNVGTQLLSPFLSTLVFTRIHARLYGM